MSNLWDTSVIETIVYTVMTIFLFFTGVVLVGTAK